MPKSDKKFDMTIIGSGPGGYVCAVRAAQLGLSVAVVEKEALPGGTCLHWGCIPTKAMLHSAEILESSRHASDFGITVAKATVDMAGVQTYREATVQANAKGVQYLFKKNNVELLEGHGRLAGAGRVEVTPATGKPFTVASNSIVIATGSVIRGLPGVEFDGKTIINSDHALHLRKVPKSMIVLGAGAVGVEFASIYRSFGAEVTVVELLPNLVPIEDEDLGKELARCYKKRGIAVHVGTRVEGVAKTRAGVKVTASKGDAALELEAEVLLVAIGRRPLTDDCGLATTQVKTDDRGFIEVDTMMRTAESGVYAIGDVLATPALAHVGSHEGVVAAEHAAGQAPHAIDYDRIPSCTYCSPEVASIGLSEKEARERGHEVAVGKFPFSAIGKAKILGDARGFVKIVSETRYDQVLGVHIVGPHATELIAEATAALALEATTASLIETIHAHPTLHEAIHEAALGVHGRSIHI